MVKFITDYPSLERFLSLTDLEQKEIYTKIEKLKDGRTICVHDLVIDKFYNSSYKIEIIEFLSQPYPNYQKFLHFVFAEDLEDLSFDKFKKRLLYEAV